MGNTEVKCPHCKGFNNYTGDYWIDEFLDDSQPTEVECRYCHKIYHVQSMIDISLLVVKDYP